MNAQKIPYIKTTDNLAALCERLKQEKFITLDTEFHRERTYYPKLCLIQIAGENEYAIIDPLSEELDLTPLKKLLLSSKSVKVMHACRQDVEIFYNLFEAVPPGIFDTQIAAMVLGHGDQVSYEKLVKHYTKEKLDKDSRFSDWARRPLTDRQLVYAIADVTHLRDIYKAQIAELNKTKRLHWVDEEMAGITDESLYAVNPDKAWERIKIRTNKKDVLGVLQSVAAWREVKAQTKNQPRQRILSDNAVQEIATQMPQTNDELAKLRGVSADMAQSGRGDQLMEAIHEGLKNKNAHNLLPPKDKNPTKRAAAIAEILRLVLKIQCAAHDVVPRLVASNEDLLDIAGDDKAKVPCMKGWRYDIFGRAALNIKHGKSVIGLDKNGNACLMDTATLKPDDTNSNNGGKRGLFSLFTQ